MSTLHWQVIKTKSLQIYAIRPILLYAGLYANIIPREMWQPFACHWFGLVLCGLVYHTCICHPGYFREPHWQSVGLPEISRVTWHLWYINIFVLCLYHIVHYIITSKVSVKKTGKIDRCQIKPQQKVVWAVFIFRELYYMWIPNRSVIRKKTHMK